MTEEEYSKGDFVIVQGTPYILDTKEDDIWWASDQDGAEIEFHPGSEDHHEKGFCVHCGETLDDCTGYKCWIR